MAEKISSEGFQTRSDLRYFLTELIESERWLCKYHQEALYAVPEQVGVAQKASARLRKNKADQLRFAGLSECRAFASKSGFVEDGFLHLPKIGRVRMRMQIPENHAIKQVTISKSATGKWHACVSCEIDAVIPKPKIRNAVKIRNPVRCADLPASLQKMLRPLARAQRKVLRRQDGSNSRKKALAWYQTVLERIINKKKDLARRLSLPHAKNRNAGFPQRPAAAKNHTPARAWCGQATIGLAGDILKNGLGVFGVLECSRNATVPQELRELTPVEIPAGSAKQEATSFGKRQLITR